MDIVWTFSEKLSDVKSGNEEKDSEEN